jgi:UDP-3-O-[3-hydroxymyristoyl] glucosamine N-acyltransferase
MSQPTYCLSELATRLGAELHGDPSCVISGVATLQHAKAQQISFLDNPRYRKYLANTQASAVILTSTDLALCTTNALIMDNPYLGYAKVASLFDQASKIKPGIHPTAVIAEGCVIDPTASIGPHCVIGEGTHIGAHSRLYANVTLYQGVRIGDRVIIHSGAVIGSDGFGFAQNKGTWYKVPQLGGVIIGNDVEIGANTTIDRGALDDTIIADGVKLDNQIQIAHNVVIGAHTAIAGCVAIAGSTVIGKYCAIGGRASIAGHITITDKVMIAGGSGVSQSITEPGVYSSSIATVQAATSWNRNLMRIYQLDEMAQRLRKLEKVLQGCHPEERSDEGSPKSAGDPSLRSG